MSEFLFKGKREDNGEWVQGNHLFDDVTDKHYIVPFGNINESTKVEQEGCCYCVGFEVIPSTVGQYTGLSDKNGKKIFDGDILKQKTTSEFAKVNSFEWERYGIVRFGCYDWNEGKAGYSSVGWYMEPLKSVSIKPKNYLVGNIQAGLNQNDINNKYHPMEVIGNIHDNPELF